MLPFVVACLFSLLSSVGESRMELWAWLFGAPTPPRAAFIGKLPRAPAALPRVVLGGRTLDAQVDTLRPPKTQEELPEVTVTGSGLVDKGRPFLVKTATAKTPAGVLTIGWIVPPTSERVIVRAVWALGCDSTGRGEVMFRHKSYRGASIEFRTCLSAGGGRVCLWRPDHFLAGDVDSPVDIEITPGQGTLQLVVIYHFQK